MEVSRQGKQLPTQLLVVAIESCSESPEKGLAALDFWNHCHSIYCNRAVSNPGKSFGLHFTFTSISLPNFPVLPPHLGD